MRHTTPLLVALCVLAPAVVAQDRDSLRIRPRPDAPPAAFSRSRIAGVEASLGRHGHAGTGALVGLVAGGAAGAALGGSCSGDFLCPGASGGSKSTKTQSRSASRRPEGDSA